MTAPSNGLPKFTPVERRILEVLSDGKDHTKTELHGCLNDDMGPKSNVSVHVFNIRKKIQPHGQDIVCVYYKRKWLYRHVCHLHFARVSLAQTKVVN